MPPPRGAIEQVSRYQESTITRAQLLELGALHSWIDRRLHSGEWQRLFPGVYVVHSGPMRWESRARGALLYAGDGAALSRAAAAYVHEMSPTPPRIVDVDVPASRRVCTQPGLRVHLRRTMPRAYGRLLTVNPGDTVVDLVAEAADVDEAIAIITAAVRARIWPREILAAAARRQRVPRRELLVDVLGAVGEGVESALEHRYRRDVERPHGLPRAILQVRQRVGGAWIRSDVVYEGLHVRVELDGRLVHAGDRADADVWRDNAVLIEQSDLTLRYRWRHIAVTPCRTAEQVASALRRNGWRGRIRPCGPRCGVTAA